MENKYSHIRGFNYEPSYASTVYESWRYFDPQIWELELRRGKDYFPHINAVRLWLDWGAWVQDPPGFRKNLEKALELVDRITGSKAIVCLLNRWHNTFLDAGGLYIDHFMPRWSWVEGGPDRFDAYLEDIVGSHKDDERVLVWDYCNEPFSYRHDFTLPEVQDLVQGEKAWLKHVYEKIKSLGAVQDAGTSIYNKPELLDLVADIEDVLLIHPYYMGVPGDQEYIAGWLKELDEYEAMADKNQKPLLITECCWGGGIDWQTRVAIMRQELSEFKKRNIGFLPHALHHSLIADLHQPEFGPVLYRENDPLSSGSMEFITSEGLLRPGHEAFNEY